MAIDWQNANVRLNIASAREGSRTVVLENRDLLTLARALEREGAPVDGVLHCLVQRFAFLYPRYTSFAEFVTAYAQPINPKWFPGGALHRAALAQARNDPAKIADLNRKAAARVRYASVQWPEIGPRTLGALERWVRGGASTVPGAVHYHASRGSQAAANAYAEERGWDVVDSGFGYDTGINVFYSVSGSRGIESRVSVTGPFPPESAEPSS